MTGWQVLREVVLRRDKYQCQTCFKRAQDVHHVIPRQRKGLDVIENLTSVCWACHKLIGLFGYRPQATREVQTFRHLDTAPIMDMKFRAKMTSMGDSIHIIIPKAYHQDAKAFLRKVIEVEIRSV